MAILKESKSKKGEPLAFITVKTVKTRADLITLAAIVSDTTKSSIVEAAIDAYIDKSRSELIEMLCQIVEQRWADPKWKKNCQGRLDRFLRKVCRELAKGYIDKKLFTEMCEAIKKKMLFEGEL